MSKKDKHDKQVTTLHRTNKQGFFEKIGRVGEKKERSIDDATKFGKRRVAAVALPVAAVAAAIGLYKMNEASDARSAEYERKIELCAGVLTGHTVELQRDPDGHLRVQPIDYSEVAACERAGGDVDIARQIEDEIQPTQAEIEAEQEQRTTSTN